MDICDTVKSYIADEMKDHKKYLEFAKKFNSPAIKGAINMIGNQELTHHNFYVSLYEQLGCDKEMK